MKKYNYTNYSEAWSVYNAKTEAQIKILLRNQEENKIEPKEEGVYWKWKHGRLFGGCCKLHEIPTLMF